MKLNTLFSFWFIGCLSVFWKANSSSRWFFILFLFVSEILTSALILIISSHLFLGWCWFSSAFGYIIKLLETQDFLYRYLVLYFSGLASVCPVFLYVCLHYLWSDRMKDVIPVFPYFFEICFVSWYNLGQKHEVFWRTCCWECVLFRVWVGCPVGILEAHLTWDAELQSFFI